MRTPIFLLALLSVSSIFAQSSVNASIIHDGGERTYSVYLSNAYTGDEAVPVVFNLHGYGSNSFEQSFYGDFRSIADTANFILVHPQGTLLNNVSHWNVGGWTVGSTVDDVSFFSALLDTLIQDYNVDESRVYSTGMSNGGYMSFRLACELSDRITAIASVTGSMTPQITAQCDPTHPMPIMQIHGTADAVVPYDGALWTNAIDDVIKYWTDFNDCSDEPIVDEVPDIVQNDDCTAVKETHLNDEGLEVIHYRIIDGGHTWPGTFFGGSGTNADFNASHEIWKFFLKYSLDLSTSTSQELSSRKTVNIIGSNIIDDLLQLESNYKGRYRIFSVDGFSLNTGEFTEGQSSIQLTDLSPGVYFLNTPTKTIRFLKL